MKKRLFSAIRGVCEKACMLAGCGTATDSADHTAGFETKAAGIYLMAPIQSPLTLNLYFHGSDVPYVSLEEWMELFTMLMSANADEDSEGPISVSEIQ